MVSGFEELADVSGAFNINDEFFPSDLTFEDTPEDVMRVAQVQITTDQTSTIQITFNSGTTWVNINNAVAINGLATFTFIVRKDTLLNFRNTDVAGLAVRIQVGV